MENFIRRWLYIGPCASCGRLMLGEEGIRVTIQQNGNIKYHHCCSTGCAERCAQKKLTGLRFKGLKIVSCANSACQGLVIGDGVWGLVDVTKRGEGVYGPLCCPKCARKQRARLEKEKPKLLLALRMRNSMMSPAPSKR